MSRLRRRLLCNECLLAALPHDRGVCSRCGSTDLVAVIARTVSDAVWWKPWTWLDSHFEGREFKMIVAPIDVPGRPGPPPTGSNVR